MSLLIVMWPVLFGWILEASGISPEVCFEPTLLREANKNYTLESGILEFPGLLKNPMWIFSTVRVRVACDASTTQMKYFVTDSYENACETFEDNQWITHSVVAFNFSIHPFTKSFIGVQVPDYPSGACRLSFLVEKLVYFYVAVFVSSVCVFLMAPTLSRSASVHYSTGTLVGVFGSLLVAAYLISRLLPSRKSIAVALYFSGWSLTAYLVRTMYHNVTLFLPYILCYSIAVGVVSFAITYYYGPIRNPRAQNIICWLVKLLAFGGIYYSVQWEAVGFCVMGLLLSKPFIPSRCLLFNLSKLPLVQYLTLKWYARYPPQKRLLTADEFEEEALRETAKALAELRDYCNSAQSKPWGIVKRLKNPDRMASFVEGDSHVSEFEKSLYDEELSRIIFFSDEEEFSAEPTPSTSAAKTDDLSLSEDSGNTET